MPQRNSLRSPQRDSLRSPQRDSLRSQNFREVAAWLAGALILALLAGCAATPDANEDARRRLGPHFLVGFVAFEDVLPLAERGWIGGILLGRRNVEHRSIPDIAADIALLQKKRQAAGLPPLIVAADQEGGVVAHLSPPLPRRPSLGAHAGDGADALERAQALGAEQGRELAALGVTLNLAPVVDLRPSTSPAGGDRSRIDARSAGRDPTRVTALATAYTRGLATAGVGATFKHFPGLARVAVDTHDDLGRLDAPLAELLSDDWQPFVAARAAGAAIMLGHVVIGSLDAHLPASLSATVVDRLRRGEAAFDGLLLTDDLNMAPIVRHGQCAAAVTALNAGVDLLLITRDPAAYYPIMDCAARALDAGAIDPARLKESRQRLASRRRLLH